MATRGALHGLGAVVAVVLGQDMAEEFVSSNKTELAAGIPGSATERIQLSRR